MSEYHNKRVRTTIDMELIPKGSTGICTAELPDDDVFAVMFDSPIDGIINSNGDTWVTFEYKDKDRYFELMGD